jgi:Uma2 family endonuclease
LHGAPDLVIEILSPPTAKYDLEDKKDVYERYGVKEYWQLILLLNKYIFLSW